MMNYDTMKKSVLAFLAVYALIGLIAHTTRSGNEDVYPFFSWFLFVNVPARTQSAYDIVLISAHGEKLSVPVSLLERPDVFAAQGMSAQGLSVISERLGHAHRQARRADLLRTRADLETHFIIPDATYALREYTFDPLEYFKRGTVASTTLLAEFTIGEQ